ncbi:MAG: Ribosome-binding factor A [Syntrophaceae bacterium PtaU1.Bin231]|nr:MAG: Ribosome-binding factor A [Syntrophaceae bacterium PtaU1.Bin231]
MTTYKRKDRLADQLKKEIADILLRQVKDPRVGSVTITDVQVTDDLRNAKVYFVEMGRQGFDPQTLDGLQNALGFIRREVGKRLQIRRVPELLFKQDESFIHGDRIERLLAEIRKEGEG